MRDIADELFILEHLPSHPRLLVKRGAYCKRGDTWFSIVVEDLRVFQDGDKRTIVDNNI